MNAIYLLIFIIIDMSLLLLAFKLLGKNGLIAIYILHIILSQITINIPMQLFGYTTVIGSSLYAVLFLTIDMVNEHFGKKEANKVVNLGVFTLIVFIFIISFSKLLISNNSDEYSNMFNKLFENQLRVVISDIVVSYFIFQKLNIWIFDKIRNITSGKILWLRNNLSTIVSQVLTAICFYELAFAGTMEQSTIWQIIFTGLAIKLVITILETPFLYISCMLNNRKYIGEKNE